MVYVRCCHQSRPISLPSLSLLKQQRLLLSRTDSLVMESSLAPLPETCVELGCKYRQPQKYFWWKWCLFVNWIHTEMMKIPLANMVCMHQSFCYFRIYRFSFIDVLSMEKPVPCSLGLDLCGYLCSKHAQCFVLMWCIILPLVTIVTLWDMTHADFDLPWPPYIMIWTFHSVYFLSLSLLQLQQLLQLQSPCLTRNTIRVAISCFHSRQAGLWQCWTLHYEAQLSSVCNIKREF